MGQRHLLLFASTNVRDSPFVVIVIQFEVGVNIQSHSIDIAYSSVFPRGFQTNEARNHVSFAHDVSCYKYNAWHMVGT